MSSGKRRFAVALMLTALLCVAFALLTGGRAFAYHQDCVDEPAGVPNSFNIGGTNEDTWVWIEHPLGGDDVIVGADVNNLEALNAGLLVVCIADVTGNMTLFTTTADPNAASVGKTADLEICQNRPGIITGCTTAFEATGAEAGTVVDCGPGTGSCIKGTTVYVDGIAVGTPNKTGADVVAIGTVTPGRINCELVVCYQEQKINVARVDVYANSATPVESVNVCVEVDHEVVGDSDAYATGPCPPIV